MKSEFGKEELRTKRVKQITNTGPSNRRKVTQDVSERVEQDKPESAQAKDKPESAKAPQDQLSQSIETSQQDERINKLLPLDIILHDDKKFHDATPLSQSKSKIKDWEHCDIDKFLGYVITRFDGTVERYIGFDRIIKTANRDDLEDMFRIGVDKYNKQKGKDIAIDMVVEWLNIMFIPDFVPDRQDIYSPIWKWELFDNCGVYSVLRRDAIIKYYLAEQKYNLGIRFLIDLFRVKLRAHKYSTLAFEVIKRLKTQLHEEMKSPRSRI